MSGVWVRQKVSKSRNAQVTSIARVAMSCKPAPANKAARPSSVELRRAGQLRRIDAETAECAVERPARAEIGDEIPYIAADHAVRAGDAAHLGDAARAVGDEVDHQRGRDHVEGPVGKRQRLRVGDAKVRALGHRLPARERDLRRPGVDRRDARGFAGLDDEGGERAGAAADVEPCRLPRRGEPVEEFRAHGAAPSPHELVVGGAVVEGRAGFGHAAAFSIPARDSRRSLVPRPSERAFTREREPEPRAARVAPSGVAPGSRVSLCLRPGHARASSLPRAPIIASRFPARTRSLSRAPAKRAPGCCSDTQNSRASASRGPGPHGSLSAIRIRLRLGPLGPGSRSRVKRTRFTLPGTRKSNALLSASQFPPGRSPRSTW